MIEVSSNLREALDSNSRVGIKRVVELWSINADEDDAQRYQISELVNSPAEFDSSSNGKALLKRSVGNEYDYNDFFSWDYFSYDTNNPKKLYRAKNQGETDAEYYAGYSTGATTIISPTYDFTRYNGKANIRFTYSFYAPNINVLTSGSFVIEFGKDKNIYPEYLNITFVDKNGSTVKTTGIFANNSNIVSVSFNENVSVHHVYIDLIDMDSTTQGRESALNVPLHRIKISKVSFGFSKVFSDEIISLSCNRESAPLSDEVPKIEASLVIWDNDRLFDPNNPNGLYAFMSKKSIFKDYLVYGNEKVLIGTYVLKDKPKFKAGQTTFNLTSFLLNELSNNPNEWTGTPSTTTMEDVVDYVVEQITGISNYFDDNEYPYSPTSTQIYSQMKSCSAVEVLQKASNNSGFALIENEKGKISGVPFFSYWTSINSWATKNYLAQSANKLKTKNICGEIEVDRDNVYPNNCNVNYYDEYGEILGYIDQDLTDKSGHVGGETADYVVENDYVMNTVNASVIASSYNDYKKGYKCTIPYFSDPTIQIGDFISFDDYYDKPHYAIVTGNNYNYPSSSSDKLTVWLIDDIVTDPSKYVNWLQVKTTISSASTDKQVPSAKAVFNITGDVSALI